MDSRSFDRLARLLGGATDRRSGLKAAFGALLGAGGAAAALDVDARNRGPRPGKGKEKDARDRRDRDRDGADASGPDAERRRKKRKTCKPACTGGFVCQKVGKKKECVCPSGVTCGEACCAAGQSCENGTCTGDPGPTPACIPAGEPCKNAGRPCCDGRVCSSGQGGDRDVACYAPKMGRCERTADCVYGMSCRGGRCEPPQPGDLGAPCDAASQQLCTTPGAVCTAYDGAGAPGGSHCTLPLESVCSGDKECTCYKCWYVNPGTSGSARRERNERATARFACCGPEGYACSTDRNCCLGTNCVNGTCRGTACVPDDARGCSSTAPCCTSTALCIEGVCKLGIPTGEACSTAAGSLPCLESAAGATCTTMDGGTSDTFCLRPAGGSCSDGSVCRSGECSGDVCAALTTEACGASASGAACKASTTDACVDSGGGAFTCLRANGTTCTANNQCVSGTCGANGQCAALTTQACGDSSSPTGAQCAATTDTCSGSAPNQTCLRANGVACSAGNQCVSGTCGANGQCAALTSQTCGDSSSPTGAQCADTTSPATCTTYLSGSPSGSHCLLANGMTCAVANDCVSQKCSDTKCVQCTANGDCATNTVCDLRNDSSTRNTCVQCAADTDCVSLGAGSCKVYTCGTSGATLNTCVATANQAANTPCKLTAESTTNDGYCQADANAGICGANVACSIKRADYTTGTTADQDLAAGNELKRIIEAAGTGTTIVGIGNGTYAPSSTIAVSSTMGTKLVEIVNCEPVTVSDRPVITGSGTQRILHFTNTGLTIRNVDLTNGKAPSVGGGAIWTDCLSGAPKNDPMTLEGVNITGSTATDNGNGGGIRTSCFASLKDTTITGCSAKYGGGIYTQSYASNGFVLNGGVSITGNTATEAYPGLFVDNGPSQPVSCTVTNTIQACRYGGTTEVPFTDCGCASISPLP